MKSTRYWLTARGAGILMGLAISALIWSCKGGGNDNPPVPCTTITFDAADAAPAAGDVFLSATGSTCSTVNVSVVINNLSGIFTVGFDLTFPSSVLQYDSYTLGPLLQKSSTIAPIVLVTPLSSGLQVAMTRLLTDGPVAATNNEVLITFQFSKKSAGTGMIDFNSSNSSTVTEEVLDENGQTRPASFGPGHGGSVVVP